jgi:hypothetical protein
MQEFTIEDNVPMPEKHVRWKYPFGKLEVGQSFFVPHKDTTQMSALCKRAARRLEARFASAKAERDGQSGTRVWRTE